MAVSVTLQPEKDWIGPEKVEIYKCEACDTVVWVLVDGEEDVACCGENMKLR
jgi:desulfoferrodoxin-like iron-binding protein